ncbi:MAG: hypothetical protein PHH47_11615 [Gallionella sp.]|nr:hypothetical protein [Gallionella sp.]MDD4947381.1 hypothetical protein [Gallionella sp.]
MNDRYTINDLMVMDNQAAPARQYYIRELLDSGCAEYQNSKLGGAEKLDIIEAIGLANLIEVLRACYARSGKTYKARHEAEFAYLNLQRSSGRITAEEYSARLKAVLSLQD